jgi:DNA-binding MarR family transcriptional regulator
MQLLPRVARGVRRSHELAAADMPAPLSRRHVAALEQLREGPLTVGALARRLGLSLSTVSGVVADLDRAGFVIRQVDDSDRRRTVIRFSPEKAAFIDKWFDGATGPLARVLERLSPEEQAAFLKAMDLLEAELRNLGTEDESSRSPGGTAGRGSP